MKKKGFTLVELLVSITIFAIIIVIMSTIFHQSSVAWSAGYRKSQGAMEARAALGYMARKLQMAVADPRILPFSLPYDLTTEITFVTLDKSGERPGFAGNYRYATWHRFYLDSDSTLKVDIIPAPNDLYLSDSWGNGLKTYTLCTNVAQLSFYALDRADGHDQDSLPECIGIVFGQKRMDEVSTVGARSAGKDKLFYTDDDIVTY